MVDDFSETLESQKRASVGQLLIRCARLFNERGLALARERLEQPSMRAAHLALFAHIDLAGTRSTEIARRAGVSKQAIGPLVDELVQMGLLERVADPADGRAKLVRFTEAGRQGMLRGLAVLREVEAGLAAQVGSDTFVRLREALLALEPALTRR